jgi:hypothetical protein
MNWRIACASALYRRFGVPWTMVPTNADSGRSQRGRMQDGIDPLGQGKDLGAIRHTAEMRGIRSWNNVKTNNSMFTDEALRQRRTEPRRPEVPVMRSCIVLSPHD